MKAFKSKSFFQKLPILSSVLIFLTGQINLHAQQIDIVDNNSNTNVITSLHGYYDGDGVINGTELTDGTDPALPCDFNAASITLELSDEFLSSDCDNDGIPNSQEIIDGTDSFDPCSAIGGTTPSGTICDIEIASDLITPDGDGINDVFSIKNIEQFPNNTVEIYNRWGVKVYTTTGYDNQSNVFAGISNGRVTINASENLPAGVYFYIINYNDDSRTLSKSGYLYINQ